MKPKAEPKLISGKPALTDKQRAFVLEYLKDWNGTQAAIRAGYSLKGADVQASRLLGNIRIQEEIRNIQDETSKKHGISRDMIVNEYRKLAFFNPTEPNDKDSWVKAGDKIRALEALCKLLGLDKPEEDQDKAQRRIIVEFKRPENQHRQP